MTDKIKPAPVITLPNWPETVATTYRAPCDPYAVLAVVRRGEVVSAYARRDWT